MVKLPISLYENMLKSILCSINFIFIKDPYNHRGLDQMVIALPPRWPLAIQMI